MSGSERMRGSATIVLLGLMTVVAAGVHDAEAVGPWEQVTDLPSPQVFTNSAPLAVLDGKIYALCGTGGPYPDTAGCREFWRYDPSDDTWTRLADLPENTSFYGGPTLAASADSVYAFSGGWWYSKWLWRYSPATNTWQKFTRAPSNTDVSWGHSMAWDGGDFLYVNFQAGGDGFYRLHLSTLVWTRLPNPPFNPTSSPPPFSVGHGSSLIWTGGDSLYLNRGVGYPWWPPVDPGPSLARYSISTNSWTPLTPPPVKIGSGMAWDGGDTFYARSDTSVFRYSISADTWSQEGDFPVAGRCTDFDLVMAGGKFFSAEVAFSPGFWSLSLNDAPVALCKDILLEAGPGCVASGSVDAGSYDPDGDDIVMTESPAGPFGLGDTDVDLVVEDVFGATDACVGTVTVADSIAPSVACNAPATIRPPDAPIAFSASMGEFCGGTVEIVGFDCWKINRAGKRISQLGECVVATAGNTVTIHESGGVGNNIEWSVVATDSSGNTTEAICRLEVVRPGGPPKL